MIRIVSCCVAGGFQKGRFRASILALLRCKTGPFTTQNRPFCMDVFAVHRNALTSRYLWCFCKCWPERHCRCGKQHRCRFVLPQSAMPASSRRRIRSARKPCRSGRGWPIGVSSQFPFADKPNGRFAGCRLSSFVNDGWRMDLFVNKWVYFFCKLGDLS